MFVLGAPSSATLAERPVPRAARFATASAPTRLHGDTEQSGGSGFARWFPSYLLQLSPRSKPAWLAHMTAALVEIAPLRDIPVHVMETEGGGVSLEIVLSDRRFAIVLDPDPTDSSWFAVKRTGETVESWSGPLGSLDLESTLAKLVHA